MKRKRIHAVDATKPGHNAVSGHQLPGDSDNGDDTDSASSVSSSEGSDGSTGANDGPDGGKSGAAISAFDSDSDSDSEEELGSRSRPALAGTKHQRKSTSIEEKSANKRARLAGPASAFEDTKTRGGKSKSNFSGLSASAAVVGRKKNDAHDHHLAFVLAALEEAKAAGRAVIFIFNDFHKFTIAANQRMLYVLLDLTQSSSVNIGIIGITEHFDPSESLEKRLKSRFSHRQIYVSPPGPAAIMTLLTRALQFPPELEKLVPQSAYAWNDTLRRTMQQDDTRRLLSHIFAPNCTPHRALDAIDACLATWKKAANGQQELLPTFRFLARAFQVPLSWQRHAKLAGEAVAFRPSTTSLDDGSADVPRTADDLLWLSGGGSVALSAQTFLLQHCSLAELGVLGGVLGIEDREREAMSKTNGSTTARNPSLSSASAASSFAPRSGASSLTEAAHSHMAVPSTLLQAHNVYDTFVRKVVLEEAGNADHPSVASSAVQASAQQLVDQRRDRNALSAATLAILDAEQAVDIGASASSVVAAPETPVSKVAKAPKLAPFSVGGIGRMPLVRRLLLVCAFCASHNPADTDAKYFFLTGSNNRSGSKRRRNSTNGNGAAASGSKTAPDPGVFLQLPKPFDFARLTQLFSGLRMVTEDADMHDGSLNACDVWREISALISVRCLERCATTDTGTDSLSSAARGIGVPTDRFRCNLLFSSAKAVAQTLGIEIEKFLHLPQR
jgi:hypothetical protein